MRLKGNCQLTLDGALPSHAERRNAGYARRHTAGSRQMAALPFYAKWCTSHGRSRRMSCRVSHVTPRARVLLHIWWMGRAPNWLQPMHRLQNSLLPPFIIINSTKVNGPHICGNDVITPSPSSTLFTCFPPVVNWEVARHSLKIL